MIKLLKTTIALTLCVSAHFTLTSHGYAATTNWQETDGARLRMVSHSMPDDQGVIKAIIEVDLEPGWKTYWREPGSSGIPPFFDFSKSKNFSDIKIHYPTPDMLKDSAGRYAGYKADVAFPVDIYTLDKTQSTHIQADIFIGVCSDICVPFSAQIDLDLSQSQTTPDEISLIENAQFALPMEPSEDLKLNAVQHNKDRNVIEFDVTLPSFYPKSLEPELFVHGPLDIPMSQPKLVDRADGKIQFTSTIFKDLIEGEELKGPIYVLLKLGPRSVQTTIELGS
jgi:DsbC/DsbD-like thiol-disulfide interchange protein